MTPLGWFVLLVLTGAMIFFAWGCDRWRNRWAAARGDAGYFQAKAEGLEKRLWGMADQYRAAELENRRLRDMLTRANCRAAQAVMDDQAKTGTTQGTPGG